MSGFLQVAFDRFDSPDLRNVVHRWKIDLGEVKSLKLTSATIQVLYDEAEVKQLTSDPVKLWLEHLNQLLYDAEDILDEYSTELLRLKLESEYHETHPLQTQQEFGRFGSQVRDINERLKSVKEEGVDLGLNPRMGSGSSRQRVFSERVPTSSLVIPSKVFGRKEDAEKIVKWLLTPSPSNSNDNNFSVQTIVGMGGSGKTTLAQLVYNHETVKNSKYFDLKGWVCVSEDFDVVRLTKEILESVTGSSEPSNSFDVLQTKLKEALSRKRFLLVLDDMWNDNYKRWEALSTPFASGKPGSKILVTTRNKSVSSTVRTVPNDHDLKGLSDEACLELVRRHAFMDGNSSDANQKLQVFGQEILNKCKGLPLAVKTLAGLLRGKGKDSDWEDILENEIWGLEDRDILPSLMLSYHHLPPLLKRCFAYCALFPKDHVFDKIELVMLWMAAGIVQQPIKLKGKKREEDMAAEYFDELFMRSFFELSSNRRPSSLTSPFDMPISYVSYKMSFYELSNELGMRSFFESSSNTGVGFVMHDLIHDLAQFVWRGLYVGREDYDKPSGVVTTTRHLYYLDPNCNLEGTKFEALKSVHTLLRLSDNNLLPAMLQCQFQFLRVLRVRNYHNCEFLDSIGKLKHLRLLDLSYSSAIKRLPDSITSLYNLQTLILIGCHNLREWPRDMGNLVNLRHLFLPTSFVIELSSDMHSCAMPLGVGTLPSLQTLNTFFVGSKNNRELRDLSQQLRGTLKILNLENVGNINGTEDMVANLKNKQHLRGLWLLWKDYESKDNFLDLGRDEKAEEDVLDQLQPHTNLEMLWVQNYGGTRFPSWIERPTFSNLTTVGLTGCHKCLFMPDLRQLPLLKHLMIKRCSATKMLGIELHGDGLSSVNNQFRSLETLRIEYMEEWTQVVEGEKGEEQFPCLRVLIVRYCPKLRMFSHSFPALVKLEIVRCDDLRELPRLLPSLQQLCIIRCPKVVVDLSCHPSLSSSSATSAPHLDSPFPCLREFQIETCLNLRELPPILPSLESLEIYDCQELCFLPALPSIKKLRLTRCKRMVLINNEIEAHHLSSLSSLTITDVSDLESLPNGFMQHLISLQELKISYCRELKALLQNEIGSAGLLPSSLQLLHIKECDNLRKLPQSICNLYCLQRLKIEEARGLASLPEGLHTLTSLQEFEIKSCHALVSLPESGLPTTLQKLTITDCKNMESLPMGLLHNLTSLQLLALYGCPKLKFLPEGLHNLKSLQRLEIIKCSALESFPDKELIPTALGWLSIKKCGKLNFSPKELHKLTNLRQLEIVGCSFLVDCKNQEPLLDLGLWNLSTTLRSLTIGGCPAIVSIPKGILPMNIREFYIQNCPNLESLPDGLSDLTSLHELVIWNCPTLTRRCEEEEGVDWSQIAQIPRVTIAQTEGPVKGTRFVRIPPRVIMGELCEVEPAIRWHKCFQY